MNFRLKSGELLRAGNLKPDLAPYLRRGANLALSVEHGSVISNCMRLAPSVGIILGGLFALNLLGCRAKAKRPTLAKSSASVVTAPATDAGTVSPNVSHFQTKPVDIGEYSALRNRIVTAIQLAADPKTSPNDALSALVQALTDAPGSAVLALELAKAAARAHDQRRFQRYVQIAQTLTAAQPNLSKMLHSIAKDRDSKIILKNRESTDESALGPKPA